MRYLTLNVVLELYRQVMEQSGGLTGIRDVFTDWQRIISSRGTYKVGDVFRPVFCGA
jgi:hypothetical protein